VVAKSEGVFGFDSIGELGARVQADSSKLFTRDIQVLCVVSAFKG
jgi:hypothetical protein